MTVQDAVQAVLNLTGILDLGGCAESCALEAGVVSLNKSRQLLQLSPTHTFASQETLTLPLLPLDLPVDLPPEVQSVVGHVRVALGLGCQLGPEIRLCATEAEFQNYFLAYGVEPLGLFDDIRALQDHDIPADYFGSEIWLPLWEDLGLLIYFDDAAGNYTPDCASGASLCGYPISRETVLVRVVLPAPNGAPPDYVIEQLRRAVLCQASAYLNVETFSCTPGADSDVARLTRRRAGDVFAMRATIPLGRHTPGPRYPEIAFVSTAKATDPASLEPVHASIVFAPCPAEGQVQLAVINEPVKWTVADVAIEGGTSPEICIAHQYCESLLLPLARHAFAQDYPHLLSNRTVSQLASLEAAATQARAALGLAIPTAGKNIQRNQTLEYVHP